jgi:hypothetical protein
VCAKKPEIVYIEYGRTIVKKARGNTIRLTDADMKADAIYISYLGRTMQENVKPVMARRSRPSLQHVFIPSKIRDYFDLKVEDLLKFDVVEERIIIKIVRRNK